MEKGRKQFTFYRSYYEALSKLPKNLRLGALEAVINYALDGTEPKGLVDLQSMAFLLIRPTLDSARRMSSGGAKKKKEEASDKVKESLEEGSDKVGARSGKGKSKEKEKEKENENEKENEIEVENERLKAAFAGFWEQYPVKSRQDEAWLAWQELRPDPERQLEGLRLWKLSSQWRKEQGRFIPSAHRFIREKMADRVPQEVPRGANGVLGDAELEAIFAVMGHEGG